MSAWSDWARGRICLPASLIRTRAGHRHPTEDSRFERASPTAAPVHGPMERARGIGAHELHLHLLSLADIRDHCPQLRFRCQRASGAIGPCFQKKIDEARSRDLRSFEGPPPSRRCFTMISAIFREACPRNFAMVRAWVVAGSPWVFSFGVSRAIDGNVSRVSVRLVLWPGQEPGAGCRLRFVSLILTTTLHDSFAVYRHTSSCIIL